MTQAHPSDVRETFKMPLALGQCYCSYRRSGTQAEHLTTRSGKCHCCFGFCHFFSCSADRALNLPGVSFFFLLPLCLRGQLVSICTFFRIFMSFSVSPGCSRSTSRGSFQSHLMFFLGSSLSTRTFIKI